MMPARERRHLALVALATLLSALVVARWVKLDPNIGALLPTAGAGADLRRYLAAFSGGEPGLVLVRGEDHDAVAVRAGAIADDLRRRGSVAAVIAPGDELTPRTTGAWLATATPAERPALLALFAEPALSQRLATTRALLLAPGSSAVKATLAGDPLRLGEALNDLRSRARPQAGGVGTALRTADGRASLIVALPRGDAFTSDAARAFTADLEAGALAGAEPSTHAETASGHAVSAASETMIKGDLARSSAVALVLASAVFLLLFRSPRVLLAVLPPLAAGTLITTLAALSFPQGLSAIAIGFSSVVLGVGADSGVHLYAATQAALREGDPDPAAAARRHVGKPVLLAALSAGGAFACLALSSVSALRQLGVLAAVGEIVTAVCLLLATPALALWLEGTRPSVAVLAPGGVASAGLARAARPLVVSVTVAALALLFLGAGPRTDGPVVALRPRDLAPLTAYAHIAETFGAESEPPTIALVSGATREEARDRADAVYETLSGAPEQVRSLDGLAAFWPSRRTLAARCAALEGSGQTNAERAAALGKALEAAGLSRRGFGAAERSLAAPDCQAEAIDEPGAALLARYVASPRADEPALATVAYLSVKGQEQNTSALLSARHPDSARTGLGTLEPALAAALRVDVPRVGGAAVAFVALSLVLVLRRARDVLVALFAIVAELSLVLLAMRICGIPLHVYDALVLPVLLGVTLDETLFVLRAVEGKDTFEARVEAIRAEAPLVATTALTTAVGFAALGLCRFDGLRHLGFVGAVGSAVGLLVSLFAVPALLPRAVVR